MPQAHFSETICSCRLQYKRADAFSFRQTSSFTQAHITQVFSHLRTLGTRFTPSKDLSPCHSDGRMKMATFPKFSQLPPELQTMVWKFSLPLYEQNPETLVMGAHVVLHTNLSAFSPNPALHKASFVDTLYPALMHICRQSRAIALKPGSSEIRFCYSKHARCHIPFRPFNPHIDVLFLPAGHLQLMGDKVLQYVRNVRYIAVDSRSINDPIVKNALARLVIRNFRRLEKLYIVLAHSRRIITSLSAEAPGYRFKMHSIPWLQVSRMEIMDNAFHHHVPLSAYVHDNLQDFKGRVFNTLTQVGSAQDRCSCDFLKKVETEVAKFLQYKPNGKWIHVSQKSLGGKYYEMIESYLLGISFIRAPTQGRSDDQEGR